MNGMYVPRTAALLAILVAFLAPAALADGVSNSQERAAAEYLAALASGSMQNLAYAIHPSEIDRLRLGILSTLREEAARGDARARARLFGAATSLADVERLTGPSFFAAFAGRLRFAVARPYAKVDGLVSVRDGKELVHVIVRAQQPKERGETRVIETVSLLPYGKDWKAAVPSALEAQIDDLIVGREVDTSGLARALPAGSGPAGAAAAVPVAANSPEILGMLGAAETALVDSRCDDYYKQHLSPGFRKTLSSRALDALINSCRNSLGARESLIAALRIVRRSPPRYDLEGARASYDVSGQGLAFDRFVLERVDGRWYVAE